MTCFLHLSSESIAAFTIYGSDLLDVCSKTYRTYKSKTSPQEALVFGLKFRFNRFYAAEHFEEVPSLRRLFCRRNMMGFCALFVSFS